MDMVRKFLFDGFVPGDYTYGTVHIGSIVMMVSLIVISIILLRGKDKQKISRITKTLAIFTLFVYVVRHVIDGYESKEYLQSMWPFYICNINTIFLCIWIIFDWTYMKDLFIITGMFGAVLMFVVPQGIFNDQFLTLTIFDSVLSHFTIVYIPLVLLSTRVYELDIKKSHEVLIGFGIILFNVEVIQPLLFDTRIDYLFLQGPLPFTIEGVPQFIIVISTAIVVVYIAYLINYFACGKLKQAKDDLNLN